MTLQDFCVQDQRYLLRKCSERYPSIRGHTVRYDGTKQGLLDISNELEDTKARDVVRALATSYTELKLEEIDYIHLERYGVPIVILERNATETQQCLVIDCYVLEREAYQLRFLTRFSKVLLAAAVVAMSTAMTLVTV